MKKITVIAALLCSAAVCAYAQQSDGTLSGAVYTVSLDGEREPVAFATVYWLGSDMYADCDENENSVLKGMRSGMPYWWRRHSAISGTL